MPRAFRSFRWILAVAIAVMSMSVVAAQGPPGAGTGPRGSGQPKGKKSFTPEQIANVQERIAIATALVDRNQEEAQARGLSMQGWRQATLDSLLSLPVGKLRQLQGVQGVDSLGTAVAEAAAAVQTEADSGLIGDTTQDLTYKPISPCRYIDTRNVGGMINGFRGYDLILAGNTYGGVAACAPVTLFAVGENAFGGLAMNVTVVDTSSGAPGFVAVKPTTVAPTSSLVNWYEAGASVQVANQAIVTMDQSGAASEFYIQSSNAVHVIVDIFGAFLAPEATALEIQTVTAGSVLGIGVTATVDTPDCPAGYTLAGGSCDSASSLVRRSLDRPEASRWRCGFSNDAPFGVLVTAYGFCARVPGR